MAVTPNLGLPLMEAGQAQKHVTHNEALLILDEDSGRTTVDLDLSVALVTPPVFPAPGFIFGASWRVLTPIIFSGGGTSWALGDDGDGGGLSPSASRYGSGLGAAAGSGWTGPVSPFPVYGPISLRVTPNAGAITGGVVPLRAFWLQLSIPPV
jgi:hypothetical protein